MRAASVILLCVLLPIAAQGRIGETALQFVDRYGPPRDSSLTTLTDKSAPLVEGAIHHTYTYKGWKIRAAFLQLDGPAVRMEFQKMGGGPTGIVIRDDEFQAIASANTPPGMSWKKTLYENADSPNKGLAKVSERLLAKALGQKVWQRTDGTILSMPTGLVIRLELPIVRQFEDQLKIVKEQKARDSVPPF